MRLIDKVLSYNETEIICATTITSDHIFYDKQIHGIHHWVAIEIMAQSSAAMAGLQNYQLELVPKMGFLMSVRDYQSAVEKYAVGTQLKIWAQKLFIDNNIGVFNCHINLDGQQVARTRISAIESDDQLLNNLRSNK